MKHPVAPYVLPFAVFMAFLLLESRHWLPPPIDYPLRVGVLAAVLWFVSRGVIDLRVTAPVATVALGVAVFVIWIAPDLLSTAYRQHWLFNNPVVGHAPTPQSGYSSLGWFVLLFRAIRAVILVPIIEELFWRAWLMRWLIRADFQSVAPGTYTPTSFWIVAVLFAAEHGPYWDVGLIAGLLYNGWMVRTRSLGDCILAHAVTNLCLSCYVVLSGNWQYW